MSDADLTERELDEALARIAGRPLPAADERTAADTAWIAEDETATPWRTAAPLGERQAVRESEKFLAGLYVSRRGEAPTAAAAHVQRVLREAWWNPVGVVPSTDARYRTVVKELKGEVERLIALPPIAAPRPSPAAEASRPRPRRAPAAPGTPVMIKEHGHVLRNGEAR